MNNILVYGAVDIDFSYNVFFQDEYLDEFGDEVQNIFGKNPYRSSHCINM